MAENGESGHVIGFASGDCGWMGLGHGNLRPKIVSLIMVACHCFQCSLTNGQL